MSSNRPSSRFESQDGSGFIQGVITADDVDNLSSEAPTERTKPLRKALRADTSQKPRGKHAK